MSDDFESQADSKAPTLISEIWQLVREKKKWWLTPIFITLLILGALVILSNGGAGPLIYTLF